MGFFESEFPISRRIQLAIALASPITALEVDMVLGVEREDSGSQTYVDNYCLREFGKFTYPL